MSGEHKGAEAEWHAGLRAAAAALTQGGAGVLEQGRVGERLYDEWFRRAVTFANGSLPGGMPQMAACTRLVLALALRVDERSAQPTAAGAGFWRSSTTDSYTAKALLSVVARLAGIHQVKPKFEAVLASPPGGPDLCRWLAAAASATVGVAAQSPTVASDVRLAAVQCTLALAELGRHLHERHAAVFPDNPFVGVIDTAAVAQLCMQPSVDMLLRGAAAKCLAVLGHARRHDAASTAAAEDTAAVSERRAAIVRTLLAHAQDAEGLTLVWQLGLLGAPDLVDVAIQRIRRTPMLASGGSRAFPQELLTSLHEDIMNRRSSGARGSSFSFGGTAHATTGAAVSGDGAAATSAATPLERHHHMFTPPQECQLARLLQAVQSWACEVADGATSSGAVAQVLEVAAAVVEEHPDSVPMLELLLATIEPRGHSGGGATAAAAVSGTSASAAEASLLAVAGVAVHLSEATWLGVVLPCVRRRLEAMGESVSGSQVDQEVVGLLREATRLYYLNHDRQPTTELGRAVFDCVVTAMRHGYSETERFAAIGAMVLRQHIRHGSAAWLVPAIADEAVRSHRTRRSLSELIMTAMGLASSAWGVDASSAMRHGSGNASSSEALVPLLAVLANSRSAAATRLWIDLCADSVHSGVVTAHQDAVAALLCNLHSEVDAVIAAAHAQQCSRKADQKPGGAAGHVRRSPSLGTALLGLTFSAQQGMGLQYAAGDTGKKGSSGGGAQTGVARGEAGAGPGAGAGHRGTVDSDPPSSVGAGGGIAAAAAGSGERVSARLSDIAELCCALAARVTPPNAPSLLDLSLKVMALLPSAKRNTIYSDATLAQVAASVPRSTLLHAAAAIPGADHGDWGQGGGKGVPDVRMAPQVLLEAQRAGGELTRAALAASVPLLFLSDTSYDVRLAAMAAIATASDGLLARNPQAAAQVLACVVADSPTADAPLLQLLQAAGASLERATHVLALHAGAGTSATADVDYTVEYEAADGAKLRLEAGEHETFAVAAPLLARMAVLAARHREYAAGAVGEVVAQCRGDNRADGAGAGFGSSGDAAAAVVSAVLGRLLRGVAASVVNDPQNRPTRDVLDAIDTVAQAAPADVLLRYAASPSGLQRLHSLRRLSRPWDALVGRWLQAGVLRVGVTGLAAGRRGAAPANTPSDGSSSSVSGGAGVTAALRSVFGRSGQRSRSAEPRYELVGSYEEAVAAATAVPSAQDDSTTTHHQPAKVSSARAGTAVDSSTAPDCSQAESKAEADGDATVRRLKAVLDEEGPLAALRQAAAHRASLSPHTAAHRAVVAVTEDHLLPAARQLLPAPVRVSEAGVPEFSVAQLDAFAATAEAARELQVLAGVPATDRVLGLSRLLSDLTAAAVNRALIESGPAAARRWMSTHGVFDPLLAAAVDQASAAVAPGGNPERRPTGGTVPAALGRRGASHPPPTPGPIPELPLHAGQEEPGGQEAHRDATASQGATAAWLRLMDLRQSGTRHVDSGSLSRGQPRTRMHSTASGTASAGTIASSSAAVVAVPASGAAASGPTFDATALAAALPDAPAGGRFGPGAHRDVAGLRDASGNHTDTEAERSREPALAC